jgi:hypothetical protein
MAYIFLSPVEQADLLVRPKDSGLGLHFGTGLSNGLVKDVLPDGGKHIATWEEFCDGKDGFIVRPERSPWERLLSSSGLCRILARPTSC